MDTITNSLERDGLIAGDFPVARDVVTLKLGQDLERGAVLGKEDGTSATKLATNDGPYDLSSGITMVLDTDNQGNETCTWDSASGYVEDTTTTYPCADQDGLTVILAVDGGDSQTCTFSGTTTSLASIMAQMNAAFEGVHVEDNGSTQPKIISDSEGTGSTISDPTGTSLFTTNSDAPVDGTGDCVDSKAVTVAEVRTVIEADTTGVSVVAVGDSFRIDSDSVGETSELDFISGDALAVFGLSVETITGTGGSGHSILADKDGDDGSEDPQCVLAADCDASAAAKECPVYRTGAFDASKLIFASGTVAADLEEAMAAKSMFQKTSR